MTTMTKQVIFDKVTDHLLTQKAVSADQYGDCFYRGPNGLKCAIGALIPDSSYDKTMEGNVDRLCQPHKVEQYNLDPEIFNLRNVDFLSDLQSIHDTYLPEEWKYRLEDYAESNKLKFNGVIE